MSDLLNSLTLPAVLYIITCVCFPHMLYSLLLKRISFTRFTDIFLLEVPLAIGMEILILGLVLPLYLYIIIGIILAALLWKWRNDAFRVSVTL